MNTLGVCQPNRPPWRRRFVPARAAWHGVGPLLLATGACLAAEGPAALTPWHREGAPGPVSVEPPPPWRVVGFPSGPQRPLPATRFEMGTLDGQVGVRVDTHASYGTLVHPWQGPAPGRLAWRWRLEKPLDGLRPPDLRRREGDDAALKVCVGWEWPLSNLPLAERTKLRLARALSGETLPVATLCYVWDSVLSAGAQGDNPYTRRVRFVVLRGQETPTGQWLDESRDVARDSAAAFADEWPGPQAAPPRLVSVLIGADSDNTAARSQGWVAALRWTPQ